MNLLDRLLSKLGEATRMQPNTSRANALHLVAERLVPKINTENPAVLRI